MLGNPLPMAGLRITYQLNDKNKFAASYDYRDRCQCPNLGSAGTSPDAAVNFMFRPQQIAFVSWSSPLTNKLLHPPTQALNAATDADREELLRLAARLFQINKE